VQAGGREIIAEQGQRLVGWRKVPTDADAADVGPTARAGEPHIEQLFIAAGEGRRGRRLRAAALHDPQAGQQRSCATTSRCPQAKMFYICSLSTKVIIYKGMLTRTSCASTTRPADPDYTTHLAMVHSRFSDEHLSQLGPRPAESLHEPQRRDQHAARQQELDAGPQGVVHSELFGDELEKLFPVVEPTAPTRARSTTCSSSC
jgi:glutamate synthase (NADPH/NADH) large chain